MFVYLSKKIAIPNNIRLNCLAWNTEEGYIAVGGDDGLVKVLKLDQASKTPAQNALATAVPAGMAAPSNLSMNQTLEGHKAAVQVITWNESMQKLTTSDRDGVIMVWMLYKGSWFEEMTNDRKKSTVKGMSWSSDGHKICIVYEDGAIIVGSADGNRIWGKELKNTVLTGVQWSPDGGLLVFSLRSGELHLYDNQGLFVMKLNVQCVALSVSRNLTVVGLHWYHGYVPANRPALVVCYENGKFQIMRNENDDSAVIVDSQMLAVSCLWNSDGTILAVCGSKSDAVESKESNAVMFYSAYGVHLRTLKLPGREITGLAWEGRSLRIAMAVDSFIYFANIRPDYIWCYFSGTVVYVNGSVSGGNDCASVTFWDTSLDQCFVKEIDQPIAIAACRNHCVIAVESVNAAPKDPMLDVNFKDRNFQLLVCNSISTTVDSKYTDIRPEYVAMNAQYVVIASKDNFLLWNYHTPQDDSSITKNLKGNPLRKDKRFHIDDTSSSAAVDVLNDLDKSSVYLSPTNPYPSTDPICSLALSDQLLLIGRESGVIMEYTMPQIVLRHRHKMSVRAHKISINSNSTRAAIIDASGVLTTIDLLDNRDGATSVVSAAASSGRINRKDVWAMCWASDNPQLLAIMEKTRMYVLRGFDPEEPISCSGYICNFEDLEITGVLLDDIIASKQPKASDHLLHLRVKSLRDTEELLAHVGINEAKLFIEDNPHPRLWRLLAEAAIRQLDYDTAEAAFVRSTNYPGIQLIKRLRTMHQNEDLQKAEVAAFFGDFDDAEKLYIDADRRDLAIELRRTLCDWFRTVQLYRMGPGMSDQQMEQVWREIGGHFANLRSWDSAKEYYDKAHNTEGLMESLYHLEQYEELEKCIHTIAEKNPLLGKLGQMLSSVGMCDQSVAAHLKFGDVKAAVNTCVALKQWGQAVELAQKYKMPQIAALLDKHATQLLQEGRLPEAIALQRKAGRYLDAARLMMKLAEGEIVKQNASTAGYLRIKKIYVMAGLLTEEHIKLQATLMGETRLVILSKMAPEDSTLVDSIWNCAKAYHFVLLAQRQLHSGLMHSAVLTALRLRDYEDILKTEEIFDLLAMTSCADRSFGTCSKAFIKLESLDSIPEHRRLAYEELAVSIFSKHEPSDNRIDRVNCFTCEALVPTSFSSCPTCGCYFPPCVASGQSMMVPTEAWQCSTCHHCAHPSEMSTRKTCPLCHAAVLNLRSIYEH